MAINIKTKTRKARKRRWDAVLVGIGMVVAFSLLITKVAEYQPSCEILSPVSFGQEICVQSEDMVKTHLYSAADYLTGLIQDLYSQAQQFLQST